MILQFHLVLFLFILPIGLVELLGEYGQRDKKPILSPSGCMGVVAGYMILAGVLAKIMYQMAQHPGADLALKTFT